MTTLNLDWESKSELDFGGPKSVGLDRYSAHPSTKIIMGAYSFDKDPIKHWDADDGPPPKELIEALEDPHVTKWAFNAQFERVMAIRRLGIKTDYKSWRCTQVLAYMQSFTGTLAQVGEQVGLPEDQQKIKDGKRLINLFCKPQKITKKNSLVWRNSLTDPEDWELFKDYNCGDVVTEKGIKRRLIKFPVPEFEWDLYHLDQQINDIGLPIDMGFARNAITMAARRKAELTEALVDLTGLDNPNSVPQLLGWLKERGYWFDDLQKETVKKVLNENADEAGVEVEIYDDEYAEPADFEGGPLAGEAVQALLFRQQTARTSTRKYDALVRLVGEDDRLRFAYQFAGASRTQRWAGRGFQQHNLPRTPKILEMCKAAIDFGLPEDLVLEMVTNLIRNNDYEGLALSVKEPMNALAGTVRSAIRAPEGYELLASDLASIETCTIAWVSGCQRLLEVISSGKDPYKDFGQELYSKEYDDVTKEERTNSKPAVLGAGFRLGGGDLQGGKRTGLWGYAENMGINLSQADSHKAVKLFRTVYPEIPKLWYALEKALETAMKTKRAVAPIIFIGGRKIPVPVVYEMMGPYMTIKLPSGRRIYYYKPRMERVLMNYRGDPTPEHPDGEPIYKWNFSYMGKQQNGNGWVRVLSHGGKMTENIVQAIARDILAIGLMRAWEAGWPIVGHVHDEIIALIRKGSNLFTVEGLREIMTRKIDWAEGMPLGAAGWQAAFYRKD